MINRNTLAPLLPVLPPVAVLLTLPIKLIARLLAKSHMAARLIIEAVLLLDMGGFQCRVIRLRRTAVGEMPPRLPDSFYTGYPPASSAKKKKKKKKKMKGGADGKVRTVNDCFAFKKGTCTRGDGCRFRHN